MSKLGRVLTYCHAIMEATLARRHVIYCTTIYNGHKRAARFIYLMVEEVCCRAHFMAGTDFAFRRAKEGSSAAVVAFADGLRRPWRLLGQE